MDDYIKNFWESNAEKFKCDSKASWGDTFLLELEYGVISKHIHDGMKVLDAGCANGFATVRHAKNNKIQIVGIDFSPNMIRYANENKAKDKLSNVDFKVGDITNIQYNSGSFDLVYTTRALINLPTWDKQKEGILECLRVCKKGGKVVILEAFYEPFIKLNSLRNAAGLSALEEHDFNRYIKKYRIEKFFNDLHLEFTNIEFSSIYYIGSRFLRELVTNYKEFEGYTNPILDDFYNLELKYSGGGFGIQQAYIVEKGDINYET